MWSLSGCRQESKNHQSKALISLSLRELESHNHTPHFRRDNKAASRRLHKRVITDNDHVFTVGPGRELNLETARETVRLVHGVKRNASQIIAPRPAQQFPVVFDFLYVPRDVDACEHFEYFLVVRVLSLFGCFNSGFITACWFSDPV